MALYEQTKSINAMKLHKNFSNFSLHLIKSIALSSLLQKLAGIITEVIKFYQAHIFPNWIQHLLYGERSSPNLFVLNKNSTTTTSTAAEGMKLTIKCETYVIDYYLQNTSFMWFLCFSCYVLAFPIS
ncbi:hypothetical protein ACKWTF_000264 [Chironomus riparius]